MGLLSPANPLDPKKIFEHAEKFQWANERLRRVEVIKDVKQEDLFKLGDPCLVLSTFASELYFKCLLAMFGARLDQLKSHNLYELFNKLPDQIKRRIETLFDQDIWEPHTREFIQKVQIEIAKEPIPRHFPTLLKLGANTFVELRYVYEKKRDIFNLLTDLPSILRRVIVEIQPSWRT